MGMSPLRVVGGEARGRALRAPGGRGTRPTSDRVREAMFDVLASTAPVEGAVVADLFAGSGALGIEALSRGARRVWFVDHDKRAAAAIRANLLATGFDARGHVVRADVLRWLEHAPPLELVLCDPPYGYDRWPALLRALSGLSELLLMETGHTPDPGGGWEVLKAKRYGGTVVTVARPVDGPAREADRKGDT
jgi:16S rRNA (guanine966-N2)-methyltransferase